MDERVCLSQNSPVLRVMEKFGGLCMSQAFLFLPCFISFSAKIGTIIPGRKTRLERGGDIETHHLLVADRYELESFGVMVICASFNLVVCVSHYPGGD